MTDTVCSSLARSVAPIVMLSLECPCLLSFFLKQQVYRAMFKFEIIQSLDRNCGFSAQSLLELGAIHVFCWARACR